MATASILFPVSSPFELTCGIDVAAHGHRLNFDASSDENAEWQFQMPANYGSGLVLKLLFACDALQSGTNNVKFNAYVKAVAELENISSEAYDSANGGTETLATDQAADILRALSITMTNADSIAAGEFGSLKVERDTTDTATGDIQLYAVVLEYTAA